ncbi:hypothetical protein KRR40_42395 [Niabella defluvii]|nr:hypothetical protein KRR40_42395 [Niabella sp. I65]
MVEAFIEIINTHGLSLQKTLDAGQQVEKKNLLQAKPIDYYNIPRKGTVA